MSPRKCVTTTIARGLLTGALLTGLSACALHDPDGKHHYPDERTPAASAVESFVKQLDRDDVVLVLDADGKVIVFDENLNVVPSAKGKQISDGSRLMSAVDMRVVEGSCVLWISHAGGVFTAVELPDSHPYCNRP